MFNLKHFFDQVSFALQMQNKTANANKCLYLSTVKQMPIVNKTNAYCL